MIINGDVLSDVANITTMSRISLERLCNIATKTIAHSMYEASIDSDDEIKSYLDIGIGKLIIGLEDNCIKYKFIPSSNLEQSLRDALLDDKDPLAEELEEVLKVKVLKAYKDLI